MRGGCNGFSGGYGCLGAMTRLDLAALRNRGFRVLGVSQIVSVFGDQVLTVAVTIAVLDSGGDATALGVNAVLGAVLREDERVSGRALVSIAIRTAIIAGPGLSVVIASVVGTRGPLVGLVGTSAVLAVAAVLVLAVPPMLGRIEGMERW